MVTKFYQYVLTLVFAIKEINENLNILPNVTLGFHICDSYSNARMTYHSTLDLLFKSSVYVPNYKCDKQKNLMAIIGGLSADISFYMTDILSLYKIPQVRTILPQKKIHPNKCYFLRHLFLVERKSWLTGKFA